MCGAEGDGGSGDGAVLGVMHDGVDLAEGAGVGQGGGEENEEQKFAQCGTPRRVGVGSKAGRGASEVKKEDLLLEEVAGRAALVAGTLAGDAALGVGSVGCGERDQVEQGGLRGRREGCGGA